jgi:predicted metal-dependent hydrolase
MTFDAPIPRDWAGDNVLRTHLANALNLLFPEGERFFVRSVRAFEASLEDEALRQRVIAFYAQEGRHAGAHERAFAVMEAHGYEVRDFLARYKDLAFDRFESRIPAELRLSVTVALEHFTAILAADALGPRGLEDVHPAMQRLLLWHAAEEIEHRSVAFDVLQRVNASYGLRMAGLAVATLGLGLSWAFATRHLLRQESPERRKAALRDLGRLLGQDGVATRVFGRGIRAYVRRGFHPDDAPLDELIPKFLERAGLSEEERAGRTAPLGGRTALAAPAP